MFANTLLNKEPLYHDFLKDVKCFIIPIIQKPFLLTYTLFYFEFTSVSSNFPDDSQTFAYLFLNTIGRHFVFLNDVT